MNRKLSSITLKKLNAEYKTTFSIILFIFTDMLIVILFYMVKIVY